MQDYIREIGACLLQLHGQAGSVSVSRAHQLVFEAIRLVGRRLRLNPTGHRALITSDARSPSHVAEDKLKPEFYISLLVCMPSLSMLQLQLLHAAQWLDTQFAGTFCMQHLHIQYKTEATTCTYTACKPLEAIPEVQRVGQG